jgi:hypothetical protein
VEIFLRLPVIAQHTYSRCYLGSSVVTASTLSESTKVFHGIKLNAAAFASAPAFIHLPHGCWSNTAPRVPDKHPYYRKPEFIRYLIDRIHVRCLTIKMNRIMALKGWPLDVWIVSR